MSPLSLHHLMPSPTHICTPPNAFNFHFIRVYWHVNKIACMNGVAWQRVVVMHKAIDWLSEPILVLVDGYEIVKIEHERDFSTFCKVNHKSKFEFNEKIFNYVENWYI